MIAGFRRQRLIPLTQDRLYVVGGKRRIGPPFSVVLTPPRRFATSRDRRQHSHHKSSRLRASARLIGL
jgi:hypothetical protein